MIAPMNLVGDMIWLKPKTPFRKGEGMVSYRVKLVGVESGGVLIESKDVTEALRQIVDVIQGETPIHFFPYSEFYFVSSATARLELEGLSGATSEE
jgi:hypothetical protein